jgi:hypothetical protein
MISSFHSKAFGASIIIAVCLLQYSTALSNVPVYSNFTLDNVIEQKIYLKVTENEEIVVVAAESVVNAKPNYVTHVDGIKILSGGLSAFLLTNDFNLAVIPIIDDEDIFNGGNRLLGFIKLETFRKEKKVITLRSGNFKYAQSDTTLQGVKFHSGSVLPEHGGGSCITSM